VRLGTADIITVVQQNKWGWYGHVSREDEIALVKNCIRLWSGGSLCQRKLGLKLSRDCHIWQLYKEDEVDCGKWKTDT